MSEIAEEKEDLDLGSHEGQNRLDELEMEQRQLMIVTRNMQLPEWGEGLI